MTAMQESTITSVLPRNDVIRHQTPSSRPTLKGVSPAGNLNHFFTGKTVSTGKNFGTFIYGSDTIQNCTGHKDTLSAGLLH